jgi:dihydroorotate dehydrogenase electron transfer subunit
MGKAFAYPRRLEACLLVAEGHGGAPILFLAQELRARGKRVDMVLGGASDDRVFKPIEAKRVSQTIAIATEDGSMGERGRVVDLLPRALEETPAQVLYAAGPKAMLRNVAEICLQRRIPSQVAVEEAMACGLGMCFTCVVPVVRKDGSGYDHVRSCVDGPVFNTARVLWDRWQSDVPTVLPTPPEGFPVVRSWPG